MNSLCYKTPFNQLKKHVESHAGMKELSIFGENLKKRPLSYEELKLDLAERFVTFS